ncbi:Maf-like protein [Clostridium omnivorum]|uniref:Maf-like protein n=1 Tax=Clostridium omnivorum TaxID=1604902 RepID=UPI0022304CD8|nr:Maf-like protein [Clostridium sp. E14]
MDTLGCDKVKIILASASERRQELLNRLTGEFDINVSNFDESTIPFNGSFHHYVMELARGKALEVENRLSDAEEKIIIGCDTIVAFNGKVLGKPKDKEDAFKMLRELSDAEHEVYSGIALVNTKTKRVITDFVCTKVKFSDLSDEEIKRYINTEEPMDKAGAYGIQGIGGIFVEKIHGCYYNVVGLPLNKLYCMLREMGVNL